MKKYLGWIVLALATTLATAQSTVVKTYTISTSGNTADINNTYGTFNPTFEEIPNGSPATVNITVQGCGKGTNANPSVPTCEAIAGLTNTSTSAAIVTATVTKFYTHFIVTATFTGGTNPSITINAAFSNARTSSGGGGAVASVFGRTGVVVATSGDYSVAQVTGAAPLVSPSFTTPTLGVATATSLNALTLTSLATGFSVAGGTASRTLTVDATVSTSALAPLVSPSFTTPTLGVATATSLNALTLTSQATGFTAAGGTASRTLTVDATVSTSALAPLASPSFTTPTLGVATATSLNALTLTSQATGFTVAGGTASRTLTVDATVSTSALAPLASPTFTGTVTIPTGANITGSNLLGQTLLPANAGCAAPSISYTGATTLGISQLATTIGVFCAGGSISFGFKGSGALTVPGSGYGWSTGAGSLTTLETVLNRADKNIISSGTTIGTAEDAWFAGSQGLKQVTAADVSSSTTTSPPTTTLFTFTLPATTTARNYSWNCRIYYSASATTLGLLVGVNSSIAPTSMLHHARIYSTLTGTATDAITTSTTSGSIVTLAGANATITTPLEADLDGTIEEAVAGGTLIINYNATSAGTLTIKRGSFCSATVN